MTGQILGAVYSSMIVLTQISTNLQIGIVTVKTKLGRHNVWQLSSSECTDPVTFRL